MCVRMIASSIQRDDLDIKKIREISAVYQIFSLLFLDQIAHFMVLFNVRRLSTEFLMLKRCGSNSY
jgi:hypothetical protein